MCVCGGGIFGNGDGVRGVGGGALWCVIEFLSFPPLSGLRCVSGHLSLEQTER